MIRYVGLLDSYPGLILPYVAFSLPLVVWIMIGFFDEIPREIDEAAMVDGLTRPFGAAQGAAAARAAGHSRRGDVRRDLHLERVPRRPLRDQLDRTTRRSRSPPRPAHRGKPDRLEHRGCDRIFTVIPILLFSIVVQRYIVRGITAGAVR